MIEVMTKLLKNPVSNVGWIRCLGLLGGLFGGCAQFEESGLPGSAASLARNQIMLVMDEPQTLGLYRLASLMRHYPDMDRFVTRHGMPQFLAETASGSQHYYILYYPDAMHAYAARTSPPRQKRLEFAGPYPITDGEKKTLENLKQSSR